MSWNCQIRKSEPGSTPRGKKGPMPAFAPERLLLIEVAAEGAALTALSGPALHATVRNAVLEQFGDFGAGCVLNSLQGARARRRSARSRLVPLTRHARRGSAQLLGRVEDIRAPPAARARGHAARGARSRRVRPMRPDAPPGDDASAARRGQRAYGAADGARGRRRRWAGSACGGCAGGRGSRRPDCQQQRPAAWRLETRRGGVNAVRHGRGRIDAQTAQTRTRRWVIEGTDHTYTSCL